jgi:plastocyanin
MKKIIFLLLVAAIILATSGCTESAPATPPATPPVPTTTKAPSPTYHPTTAMPTLEETKSVVNDNMIMITRDGFSPANLTVKKGGRVTWLNTDTTDDQARYNPTHRIRITRVYDLQVLSPGLSCSWVFSDPGVFPYTDMVHTDLHGVVTVVR